MKRAVAVEDLVRKWRNALSNLECEMFLERE